MATARGALARARSERRSAWRRADEKRNARAEREAAAAMATRFLDGMRRYAVTRRATGSDGFSGPLVVPRRPTCRSCEPSVRIRVLRLFFCMLLSYTVNLLGVNQGPPLLEDDFRVSHTFSAARRGEKAASWGRTRSRRRARPPRREPARVALAAADRSEGALPSFPGFLASLPVGTPEIFRHRLDARDAQPPTVSPFPFPSRRRRIGFGGYSGAQSLSSQTYDDAAGAVEVDDDLARVMARLVKHNTATAPAASS